MLESSEIARNAMRQATAETHTRVEALLGLGVPSVTWPTYLTALEALASVYSAVAAWLPQTHVPTLAAGPWGRLSVHMARLQADIRYARAHLGEGGGLLPTPAPPALWGDAHGFGMLYVIEGSTLGGQYIARNITERFGLDAAHGLAFFQGDGTSTGALWRDFRDALGRHVCVANQVELAVAGATWTFEALERAWEQGSRARRHA
jgi:heme oxygenase